MKLLDSHSKTAKYVRRSLLFIIDMTIFRKATQHCCLVLSRCMYKWTEPPYTVTSDASNYTDGQVITVTLQANNTGFKGFLLQARDEKGPVGTFTVLGNNSQLLSCGTEGSAVSHTSNDVKSTIVAQWKAPNINNTDIHFRATFVQNFSLFWVGVQNPWLLRSPVTGAAFPGTT
ncbi:ferric-chelate reductase [Pimephales promelas]|nr:ferric-chelate reductase [Pimephales promelas]